jgi:hypothetical protein
MAARVFEKNEDQQLHVQRQRVKEEQFTHNTQPAIRVIIYLEPAALKICYHHSSIIWQCTIIDSHFAPPWRFPLEHHCIRYEPMMQQIQFQIDS